MYVDIFLCIYMYVYVMDVWPYACTYYQWHKQMAL